VSKDPCPTRLGNRTPKHLQQPAQFVLEVDALLQDRLAAGQESAHLVAMQALDVDPAVPAGPEDLGKPAGVVAVGLVAHRRQRDADLPGLQADHFEAGRLQAVGQVLGKRAGLEADRLHIAAEPAQAIDDGIDLGRHFGLKADLALVVHDADRDRPQRHVDSGVVGHFHLLLDGCSSLWRARRATSPPDHQCFWRTRAYANVSFYEDSFVKMIAGSWTPHEDGYRGMSACWRFRPGSEAGV
jgi:hypothetical protein